MQRCAYLAWLLLVAGSGTAVCDPLTVRDDVGRTRELPKPAARVIAAGGPAEVLLQTLAPERLAAANRDIPPAARRYLSPALQPRAVLRRLPEAHDASRDAEVLQLAPDLILDYGSLHPDYVARADAIEERLKVPYLLFDGALARIPGAYRSIGPLVGAEARGAQLAELSQRMLDRYAGFLAKAPARRIYVTDSPDGLLPVFTDQSAAEVFAWLGLENVAGRLDEAKTLPITFADIRGWRPDVIFALDPAFAARARDDARWRDLPAVQAGRVYVAPRLPFDWIARPPSVNRLLGVVWVARTLSPPAQRAAFDADLRELFATLLQRELTEAELAELLGER
jgi:iron complex transport system substrate-binding protein